MIIIPFNKKRETHYKAYKNYASTNLLIYSWIIRIVKKQKCPYHIGQQIEQLCLDDPFSITIRLISNLLNRVNLYLRFLVLLLHAYLIKKMLIIPILFVFEIQNKIIRGLNK